MRNRERICTGAWISHDQLAFDDTYKQLRRAYAAGGRDAVVARIANARGPDGR